VEQLAIGRAAGTRLPGQDGAAGDRDRGAGGWPAVPDGDARRVHHGRVTGGGVEWSDGQRGAVDEPSVHGDLRGGGWQGEERESDGEVRAHGGGDRVNRV
jgi:hypothetical protein